MSDTSTLLCIQQKKRYMNNKIENGMKNIVQIVMSIYVFEVNSAFNMPEVRNKGNIGKYCYICVQKHGDSTILRIFAEYLNTSERRSALSRLRSVFSANLYEFVQNILLVA